VLDPTTQGLRLHVRAKHSTTPNGFVGHGAQCAPPGAVQVGGSMSGRAPDVLRAHWTQHGRPTSIPNVIRRKNAWQSPEELEQVAARSKAVADADFPTNIRWIRSYVVAEDRRHAGDGLHLPSQQPRGSARPRPPRGHAGRRDLRRRHHRRRPTRPGAAARRILTPRQRGAPTGAPHFTRGRGSKPAAPIGRRGCGSKSAGSIVPYRGDIVGRSSAPTACDVIRHHPPVGADDGAPTSGAPIWAPN
jgi:hypothetical protein